MNELTIKEYPITSEPYQEIEIPDDAIILDIVVKNGLPYLSVLCCELMALKKFKLVVLKHGEPIRGAYWGGYVGSFSEYTEWGYLSFYVFDLGYV